LKKIVSEHLRDLKKKTGIDVSFFEDPINILADRPKFVGEVRKLHIAFIEDFLYFLAYLYGFHTDVYVK
jgi:hypothetical protein